jgi:ABC-2 type transport system ATP-binding protein
MITDQAKTCILSTMKYAVEITGVNKTYDGGVVALKDINFKIAEGDFFALLGPNGAGKSTLISIMSQLTKKTSGTVSILGTNIDTGSSDVKMLVGLVPQEFNFNIFETVANICYTQAGYYGLTQKEVTADVEKLLKDLGLWDKRDAKVMQLSGGMKRRVMIARALVHKPKLLILDEPTAGVDVELRIEMWKFLEELNQSGVTIILTTHYLEEAEKLCRNIAIIQKGEVKIQGTMKEVMGDKTLEAVFLDSIQK